MKRIGIVAIFLLMGPLNACEPEPGLPEPTPETFRADLREMGILSETQIAALTDATFAYLNDGESEALERLISGENESLANVAINIMINALDLPDAIETALEIKEMSPRNEAAVCSGLAIHSPEGVDYLIEHFDAFDEQAISTVFDALTGESFNTREELAAWWQKNRDQHETLIARFNNPLAVRAEILKRRTAPIKEALSDLPEDSAGSLLIDMFDSLDVSREAALAHDPGPWTIRGDRHFYFGRFEMAANAYQEAINENPENGYARYLLGCSLFESGNYPEALQTFQIAYKLNPSHFTLRYLIAISQRRIDYPNESIIHAGWNAIRASDILEDFGTLGISDPIIAILHGQQMLEKPGIYFRPISELLERSEAHSGNPDLALGYVLLTPKLGRTARIEEFAAAHPDHFFSQQALCYVLLANSTSQNPERVTAALEACRLSDPDNAYYSHYTAAWLGMNLEPLSEENFPPDWPEYKNTVALLTEEQLVLMHAAINAPEYTDPLLLLQAARDAAMADMGHPYHYHNHAHLDGFLFSKRRSLIQQIELTAQVAIHHNNLALANKLISYLEFMAVERDSTSESSLDRMVRLIVKGIGRSLRVEVLRAEGKEAEADTLQTSLEERSEINETAAKTKRILETDIPLGLIPLPSVSSAISELDSRFDDYIEAHKRFWGE